MRVLVTGATGFVGRHLVRALREEDREVVVTSRDAERAERSLGEGVRAVRWMPRLTPCPTEALEDVTAIVHLLGEPVAGGLRWTKARKRAILESREAGTRHLVETLRLLPEGRRPEVLVSASAVGFYGDGGDEVLREDAPAGDDFLAQVCVAWEREARAAEALGVRVVLLRIGIVLGPDGGPLEKMLPPFKAALGGRMGPGTQYMPWVHVDDVVGLALHAIRTPALSGPLNTAPAPSTNAEFTKTLGRALHRPTIFPAPRLALKLLLGEMADVLLFSQRTSAEKATASGYAFRYPELDAALEACVRG